MTLGSAATNRVRSSLPDQGYNCKRGYRLAKRGNGYVCRRRGHRSLAPKCDAGYQRRTVLRGWRCRYAPTPATSAPAPAPAPAPGAAPKPAPPAPPQPAPASTTSAHIKAVLDYNYAYAYNLGQSFYGVSDYSGYFYNWGVDRNQCVMLDANTGRCWLFLWRQNSTEDSSFHLAYIRYTIREAVFADDVGNNVFQGRSNQFNLSDAWSYICTDVVTPPSGLPLCSPSGPWF